MTSFSFSLRWLLAGVLFVAVSCAGLVYPSLMYASLLAAALVAILAAGLVAALVSPGRYRALGLGMLVFAGCYGVALWRFEPAFRFTELLSDAYSGLSGSEVKSLSESQVEGIRRNISMYEEYLSQTPPNSAGYISNEKQLTALRRSIDAWHAHRSFIRVSYCLLAFVAAACGAVVAGWFYDRRDK